ncbi:MAG: beta-lactamase family protein, partial [Myxococcales bacterium]|nr:beta-lactamase family protein [Myxococcales bacterium]
MAGARAGGRGMRGDVGITNDAGLWDASLPDASALDSSLGPPPEELEAFVQYQMELGGIPGLAAGIIKDDARIWTGTFGFADLEAGMPVTADTLFMVASVSKTITQVPILQEVEAGLLDLDAPITDYLPYPIVHPLDPGAPITARQLLTHSSGLADDWLSLSALSSVGDPTIGLRAASEGYVTPGGEFYAEGNFGAAPGTRWDYCNAGFMILGDLAEAVGASSLREQLRLGLFEPLGMSSSGFFLADIDVSRLAMPYAYNRRGYTPLGHPGFGHYPAASLRTSLNDLSRFLRAHMRGGELDGAVILEPATLMELWTPQVPALSTNQGLTWRRRSIGGVTYFGHSGSAAGVSAEMLFRPEDAVGIVMLTNSDAFLRTLFGSPEG